MGTLTFCEILRTLVRQSRFRLVHELNWSFRRSLCYQICRENFKKQVPEVKFSFTSTQYRNILFCTCQGSNTITMPKIKHEKNSDSKHKDDKESKKVKDTKSHSLKLIKKKKKKKHHHHRHKRKHSKRHSSHKKNSRKEKPELILLDSSSDSDILFLYDSRTKTEENNKLVSHSQLSVCENFSEVIIRHCAGSEENYNFEETEANLTLHQVTEQNSSETPSSESKCVVIQKEQFSSTVQPISSEDGVSSVLKSEQAVSGPSGIQGGESENTSRRWEFTKFGQTMPNETKDSTNNERKYLMFNVLSYNVLCQEILEDHMELYEDIKIHYPIALDWEYRSKLLMKELLEFDADVICLQEVQKSHLTTFYSELKTRGYTELYKQRTGGQKDGVAIYFRKSVFEMVDYTTVEYYQPGVFVLNRHNVGLIVKLAPKMKPDERIVVATTHLLYNPRRHDVKLAQTQILLAEVERFAFKEIDQRTKAPKYWPVILTGDMNFEPNSGGFKLLNMGWFRYDGLSSKTLTKYDGWGPRLGKKLIPSDLWVTDTCQHWILLVHRTEQSTPETVVESKDDHKTEIKYLRIYNSEFEMQHSSSTDLETLETNEFYQDHKRFGSGKLKHPLELKSVYRFDSEECLATSQVSTFQDGWVVVDYIFYRGDRNPEGPTNQEGNLKLVARYKLLSAEEATKVGPIPNLSSPSDHYPLAAKFALLF